MNSRRGPGRVPGSSTMQVAGLRRQRDALVGVVEADGRRRHADLFQCLGDGGGDGCLLTGHPFDGRNLIR